MARYICEKCGTKFDKPFREHDDLGGFDCCPNCGNLDFEAAAQCRGCRKDMEYSKLIAGEYCPECIDAAIRERWDLVEEYMMLDDVRENFAEFLAETQWAPWREAVLSDG